MDDDRRAPRPAAPDGPAPDGGPYRTPATSERPDEVSVPRERAEQALRELRAALRLPALSREQRNRALAILMALQRRTTATALRPAREAYEELAAANDQLRTELAASRRACDDLRAENIKIRSFHRTAE